MTNTNLPDPDPTDPQAVALAAELTAKTQLVRLGPGEAVVVRPKRRFDRYAIAYSVNRLTSDQHAWLTAYSRAAKAKRRADRAAQREAGRAN